MRGRLLGRLNWSGRNHNSKSVERGEFLEVASELVGIIFSSTIGAWA